MELKDLVGEHTLDAVDSSNEEVKTWGDSYEHAAVIRFRLDGTVYTATEDPDDGYRSSMSDIVAGDGVMSNTFPSVRVVARHRTQGKYGYEDDVIELIDLSNGEVILEVGTEAVDDYYPVFVDRWYPARVNWETT